MKIDEVRRRIENGKYLIKIHAIHHALKEGFEQKNMLEAVKNGKIIEEYTEDCRILIGGAVNLTDKATIYLDVVCEYADDNYVKFVTAYIPDNEIWENPPFRRRR